MSDNITISRGMGMFLLRRIIDTVAYDFDIGTIYQSTHCTRKHLHLDDSDFEKLNVLIESEDFPAGYYKLCDILDIDYKI